MFVEDRKSDIQLSIMALLSSTAFCQCLDSMNGVHSKVEAFKASRTWVLFDRLTMRTQLNIIWQEVEHVENKQWTWMNWKHWVTTQEPWHYSSSCCLSIQPFLQNNYPPPHFRISFVKLVTDLFILLAFAAFFYLFSFFVIFFRFLLCFVVFLIWWCFLKLHSFWPLRTTVTFAIFC